MKKQISLKVAVFVLAMLAFAACAFGLTKTQAATEIPTAVASTGAITWKYDAVSDSLVVKASGTVVSPAVFVTNVGSTEEKTVASNKFVKKSDLDTTTGAAIDISGSTGLKVALNKDVQLFVTAEKPKAKAKYTANVVIAASEYKKVAVTLNYVNISSGASAKKGTDVFTVTATKTDGTTDESFAINKLEVSFDGKVWLDASTVTGKEVYGKCIEKQTKAQKIYFRVAGKSSSDNAASGGVRPSASVKVTVKLPAKAPTLKVNVKTSSLPIKNGYDYIVVASGEAAAASITNTNWNTIKAYKKDTSETSTILTTDYVPVKYKSDDNVTATSYPYTSVKVTSIDLADVLVNTDNEVLVRKSATINGPCSEAQVIKLSEIADAPVVTASAIKISTSAGATTFASGSVGPDENDKTSSPKFEYVIVHGADVTKIDYTSLSWKELKSTDKFTVKTKTFKYKTKEGTETTTVNAETVAETGDVILIRRAGVAKKSGKTYSYVLASDFTSLKIVVHPEDEDTGSKSYVAFIE